MVVVERTLVGSRVRRKRRIQRTRKLVGERAQGTGKRLAHIPTASYPGNYSYVRTRLIYGSVDEASKRRVDEEVGQISIHVSSVDFVDSEVVIENATDIESVTKDAYGRGSPRSGPVGGCCMVLRGDCRPLHQTAEPAPACVMTTETWKSGQGSAVLPDPCRATVRHAADDGRGYQRESVAPVVGLPVLPPPTHPFSVINEQRR